MPSLREYIANYQIDSRRLHPRQLLMHPGPVNRGVELSAEVIESPQALIVDQVAAGLVVRMAILYELLSGGRRGRHRAGARSRRWSSRHERAALPAQCGCAPAHAEPRDAADPRRPPARPARRASTESHDLLVRDGVIAEIGAPGALERARGLRGGRGGEG